jgi:hypothetical protein
MCAAHRPEQALTVLAEERVRNESDLAAKLATFIPVRISFWNEQRRKHSIAWQKEVVLYLQSMFAKGPGVPALWPF